MDRKALRQRTYSQQHLSHTWSRFARHSFMPSSSEWGLKADMHSQIVIACDSYQALSSHIENDPTFIPWSHWMFDDVIDDDPWGSPWCFPARLEQYGRNLVEYGLILDVVHAWRSFPLNFHRVAVLPGFAGGCSANSARPMLASLYMSRRMPSVRLSSLQGGQFSGNLLGYTGPVEFEGWFLCESTDVFCVSLGNRCSSKRCLCRPWGVYIISVSCIVMLLYWDWVW